MQSKSMQAENPLIRVEHHDDIAFVTLNRAAKRNAINDALLAELDACFPARLGNAKVVVLAGTGEHFCAGLDLFELMATRGSDPMQGMRRSRKWHEVFDRIQFGEVPVVSVLKGGVIGGGFELAAATHVRVCEASAFFQLPEGQRGIFLGGGGSVRIPRIIGAGRVTEMMLTGRQVDARAAHALGVAHEMVPDGTGMARAKELARAIASNASTTNFAIINGIQRIGEMSMGDGMFAETMVTMMTRVGNTGAERRIHEFFEGRRQVRDDREPEPT